jgi:hypothetical protein
VGPVHDIEQNVTFGDRIIEIAKEFVNLGFDSKQQCKTENKNLGYKKMQYGYER